MRVCKCWDTIVQVNCTLCIVTCSILNRLTPEKFDKLSFELLNVGIDSQLVLKGIIILVGLLWLLIVINDMFVLKLIVCFVESKCDAI